SDATSLVYGYRRLKVQKTASTGQEALRVIPIVSSPESHFRFPPQQILPKLRRCVAENANAGEKLAQFEVSVDLSKAHAGQIVDIIYEHYSPGDFLQRGAVSTTIASCSHFDTGEVTRWCLMPRGREYRSFQIVRYETGKLGTAEVVKGLTEYMADD